MVHEANRTTGIGGVGTPGTSDQPPAADSETVSANTARYARVDDVRRTYGTGVIIHDASTGQTENPPSGIPPRGLYITGEAGTTPSTSTPTGDTVEPTSEAPAPSPSPAPSPPPSPSQPSQSSSRSNHGGIGGFISRIVSAPFKAVGTAVRGIAGGLVEGAKKLPVIGPVVNFVQNAANKVKKFFQRIF